MYHIKLTNFEGPLDLLHQLIEAKKLDITEISLAEVAGQFLNYLKNSGRLTMQDTADFLTVAGRLALIKSRALLPFLKLSDDEEKDIEGLKEQLAEYKKYKELSRLINKLDKMGNRFYERSYLAGLKPVFYFPKKLAAEHLSQALENLLGSITLPQRIPQARLVEKISLEQKLAEMESALKNRVQLNFSEIALSPNPEEKIVAFLSVLELLKRSKIQAEQRYNFEEIKLKWLIQQI
ncbi:MAG: segregation/condensation protein A [Parcubacteria group bacterium]|nr:segregation/condensation protein A [Parcubacteria group bacterium]